jgi:hypothetical protein
MAVLSAAAPPIALARAVVGWLTAGRAGPSAAKPEAKDEPSVAVCRDSAAVERWVSEVNAQTSEPTAEQWARFQEMGIEAQKVAHNLAAGLQARSRAVQLAAEHGIASDDPERTVKLFRIRAKALWSKRTLEEARLKGQWQADRDLRQRIRAAEHRARQMGLLPSKTARHDAVALTDSASPSGAAVVHAPPAARLSKSEKRRENVAVLDKFGEALWDVAWQAWAPGTGMPSEKRSSEPLETWRSVRSRAGRYPARSSSNSCGS